MPEGDAIFRTARTLHRALAGVVVTRFESVLPSLSRVDEDAPITGRTIERVEAAGKHVLMHFSPRPGVPASLETTGASGALVLRTHMRMNGSWHIYRAGERWRRPHRDMRIVVATDTFEAVAFTVPVAEWLFSAGTRRRTASPEGTAPRSAPTRARPSHLPSLERQEDLRRMGPDLLGDAFDEEDALQRIRARGSEEIADVLLNQRVVAGIGNVYKSEVLFMCRINPFAPAAMVEEPQLRLALQTARRLLQANVTTLRGGITTYIGFARGRGGGDADRRYVYGRARRPCRRCATPIRVRAQGPHARLTYWCPRCQP